MGRFTRQHSYGEGMMDVFKSFGSKMFGKTMKTAAKKGAEKALTSAATKTGEYAKQDLQLIIQMLLEEQMMSREELQITTFLPQEKHYWEHHPQ